MDSHRTEFTPILESLEESLRVARYELEWYKTASVPIIRWIRDYNERSVNTEPPRRVTTPLPEEDLTKYRLPTNVKPQNYSISLTPNLVDFTFDGTVNISVVVLERTNLIILHSAELEYISLEIVKSPINVLVIRHRLEKKYEFLHVKLNRVVDADMELTIKIVYKGTLASNLRGFYKSYYVNNDKTLR